MDPTNNPGLKIWHFLLRPFFFGSPHLGSFQVPQNLLCMTFPIAISFSFLWLQHCHPSLGLLPEPSHCSAVLSSRWGVLPGLPVAEPFSIKQGYCRAEGYAPGIQTPSFRPRLEYYCSDPGIFCPYSPEPVSRDCRLFPGVHPPSGEC